MVTVMAGGVNVINVHMVSEKENKPAPESGVKTSQPEVHSDSSNHMQMFCV